MQRIDTDVSVNLVVFEVRVGRGLETVVGQAPTRSAHAIELAWAACSARSNIQPSDVRQVYSEWQPSLEDTAFLEATLSGAAVTYSFARPAEDDNEGWDLALREAALAVERSVARKWWQFWR